MYGGDGFWMLGRSLRSRLRLRRGAGRRDRPRQPVHARNAAPSSRYAHYGEKKLRFNWNTPIQMSPNEKGTIYIGAQFLFRSRDHGQSWDRISPDLTTNDPEKQKQEESGGVTIDNSAAEMHTTIYSISRVAEERPDHLGRHRRRQRADHARRREDLDQRRRERSGTRPELVGVDGRGQPLRRRHRVRDLRSPHVRRHEAVRFTRPPTSARPGRR